MRILFIDFNHSYAGGQVYIKNVICQLKKMKIKCWLISNNPGGFFAVLDIAPEYCIQIKNRYIEFIKIADLVNRTIMKHQITHVVFNGNKAMYLSFFIKSNNKFMITHTMPSYNKGVKYLISKFALQYISLHFMKKVITLSNIQKKELIEYNIDEKLIEVVYNGVNRDFFLKKNKVDFAKKEIVFIKVANLEIRKGFEESINAFLYLVNRYDNIKFWIIGSGKQEYETYLKKLVQSKKNTDGKVVFWGFQKDVKSFLHKSDVFILPSHNECLPISILEAMASSLPIITTNVGGIPEIIEDGVNGFLIEPGNKEALADRMEKIIQDVNLRIRMADANYLKCKKYFQNEKTVKSLLSVIKK